MKKTTLMVAAFMLTTTFVLAQTKDAPKPTPGPLHLMLAIDGTASLTSPSPINPNVTQREVLFSVVPTIIAEARQRDPNGQVHVFVICHTPLLIHEGNFKRSGAAEIIKNVELAGKDCTQSGTRIDLTLQAIGQLASLQTGPNVAVLLTDGVNESERGLRLNDGYNAIAHLKRRPPLVLAMLGLREDLRLPWELASRRTLPGTSTVMGGSRDLGSTLKRLRSALSSNQP